LEGGSESGSGGRLRKLSKEINKGGRSEKQHNNHAKEGREANLNWKRQASARKSRHR